MTLDPRMAFESLFGDGGTPEERAARQKVNRSILDWISHDVARLQKGLGASDRNRLSQYLDDVREIELVPLAEIRSKLVSGDMKASAFTTRIVDLDGVVHIANTGRYTPNVWVPPLIGPALIEGETRRQYAEIRSEIVRRARRAAGVASN